MDVVAEYYSSTKPRQCYYFAAGFVCIYLQTSAYLGEIQSSSPFYPDALAREKVSAVVFVAECPIYALEMVLEAQSLKVLPSSHSPSVNHHLNRHYFHYLFV